jgi:hypothetical protein
MKVLLASAILGLLAMGASAQTKGVDTTVFGFQLGGKFAMPECEREPNHSLIDSVALLKKMHAESSEMSNRNIAYVEKKDAQLAQRMKEEREEENARFAPILKEDEENSRKEIYAIVEHSSPCFEWPGMTTAYVSANIPVVTAKIRINLPVDQIPESIRFSGFEADAQVVDGNLESISFSTAGLESQDQVLVALEKKYGKPTHLQEERKQNAFGARFISHYVEWRFANLVIVFWGATNSVDGGSIRIDTKKGSKFRLVSQKTSQTDPKL